MPPKRSTSLRKRRMTPRQNNRHSSGLAGSVSGASARPLSEGFLDVGDGHSLHYETWGNADAAPLLYLHGGPGSGAGISTFDPLDLADIHLILFDQRGAGKSTPHAGLHANTTAHLVEDIEALRCHLGLTGLALYGHSWGSTLALAYAAAYPDEVRRMTLSGIYLSSEDEIDWWYRVGGAPRFRTDAFALLVADLPDTSRTGPDAIISHYVEAMAAERDGFEELFETAISGDTVALSALQASHIYRWTAYEYALTRFLPRAISLHEAIMAGGAQRLMAHSLIEAHYFQGRGFMAPDALLTAARTFGHIPVDIVQGRYDMVCPPAAAFALHEALPDSRLTIVETAGHGLVGDLEEAIMNTLALSLRRLSNKTAR